MESRFGAVFNAPAAAPGLTMPKGAPKAAAPKTPLAPPAPPPPTPNTRPMAGRPIPPPPPPAPPPAAPNTRPMAGRGEPSVSGVQQERRPGAPPPPPLQQPVERRGSPPPAPPAAPAQAMPKSVGDYKKTLDGLRSQALSAKTPEDRMAIERQMREYSTKYGQQYGASATHPDPVDLGAPPRRVDPNARPLPSVLTTPPPPPKAGPKLPPYKEGQPPPKGYTNIPTEDGGLVPKQAQKEFAAAVSGGQAAQDAYTAKWGDQIVGALSGMM